MGFYGGNDPSIGSTSKSPMGVWRLGTPEAVDTFCENMLFEQVLRCMHDYTNQFNMK